MIGGLLAAPGCAAPPEKVSKIAFGSCLRHDQPQPVWEAVVRSEPDLFIFLGDNVYADTEDMDEMRAAYRELAANDGFQRLQAACPIVATWDDHDYGANDAGADYAMKEEAEQVFLEFWGVPPQADQRQHEGVYGAYVFGPAGQRVQVILLDTRYFRSELPRAERSDDVDGRPGRYDPVLDPDATLLGEKQWQWLEQQFREPADLRLICSSIQIIPDGHRWEKWGNFPLERERLFKLIDRYETAGVVFLSGDRHSAEISVYDPGVGYGLPEVTSSALNQSVPWHNEHNEHRLGSKYTNPNFGLITIDWDAEEPLVLLEVRNEQGDPVLRHRVRLKDLQVGAAALTQ
jgi:alkaline phosphatase D